MFEDTKTGFNSNINVFHQSLTNHVIIGAQIQSNYAKSLRNELAIALGTELTQC